MSKHVGSAPSQRLSAGLNIITPPSTGQVNFPIPNPVVPESNPLTDLAESLSTINRKLKQYSQANEQQYKTEADIEAQRVIDERLAAGDTFEKIRQDFYDGVYDDSLKMQMHYDSFNTAFGAKAWQDFAEDEGRKIKQQMMSTVEGAPFTEVEDLRKGLNANLASLSEKFRSGIVGNNLKMLAGSEQAMMTWRAKAREDFNKAYDIRYTTERINTGVANTVQFIENTLFDIKPEGAEENLPQSVNTVFKEYVKNVGLGSSSIKRLRLDLSQRLLDRAINKDDFESSQRMQLLRAAESLLENSPEQGIPAPLYDNSLVQNVAGTGGSEVRAKASSLLKDIKKAQGDLVEGASVMTVVGKLQNGIPITSDDNKLVSKAGQIIFDNIEKAYSNNPVLRNQELARAASKIPSKHIYISSMLNAGFSNLSGRLKSTDSRELARVSRDVNTALQIYASMDVDTRNKYYPQSSNTKKMLDYLLAKKGSLTAQGEDADSITLGKDDEGEMSVLGSTMMGHLRYLANKADSPGGIPKGRPLAQDDISDIFSKIEGDIVDATSIFDTRTLTPHARMVVQSEIFRLSNMYNMEGLDKADIVDRIAEDMKSQLMSVDGTDHIFRVPKRSPFRNQNMEEAANYLKDTLSAFASKNSKFLEDRAIDPDELTVMNISSGAGPTNQYFIVSKGSVIPLARDAITISDETVQNYIAEKRAGTGSSITSGGNAQQRRRGR